MSKEFLMDFHSNDLELEKEQYIDLLILSPWQSAKELCDNVGKIPTERCAEVSKEIDDTIALLSLAKLGLQQKQN